MFDKNHGLRPCAVAFAVAVALGLSACGGGGGNVRPTSPPPPPPAGGTGFTGGEIDVDANSVTVLSGNYSGSIDLIKGGAGMLTLTGSNTYTGGTTINQGILQIGAGGTTGSITGNVVDNALLAFDRSDALTFDGVISGSGVLRQIGSGTLTLTGNNTYTGGTTISSGTLQLGNGGTSGGLAGNIVDNATLTFDRSDDFSFANVVTGTGGLIKSGSNALTLTGSNTYTGSTQVQSGSLFVDGDQTAAKGVTTVANGATFGGKGIIGGDVNVADGAMLAPGSKGAIGTLTINGKLGLSSGSVLNYDFGAVSGNTQPSDLINVYGNLTLDGTLNVSVPSGGDLGPGVHRLINFGGTLTDNGLTLGNMPSSGWVVQTGAAQQINLVDTRGMVFSYWDGDAGRKGNSVIDGGNGTWTQAGSSNNWTDVTGAVNAPFSDNSFAVFQGLSGIVNVSDANGAIHVAGMQFVGGGYVLQGDPITLAGSMSDPSQSIIRVGDGTAAGKLYRAVIGTELDGSSALVKTDAGTLVLGDNNGYTGGTTVSGGTLQIGNTGTSGSILGDVTDNASLAFSRSDDVTYGGIISGSGSLVQSGPGKLTLTGANTFAGGTTVNGGTLEIAVGASPGPGSIIVGIDYGYYPNVYALQVDAGVSLSNRIVLDSFATLDNQGALGGNVDFGVEGKNLYASGNVTIHNHDGGSIEGNNDGVVVYSTDDSVINDSGATIQGGNAAIFMTYGGSVVNDGVGSVIFSPGIAIGSQFGGVSVTNSAGAVITGGSAAISGTSYVNNTGAGSLISAPTGRAIFNGYSVYNMAGATISSGLTAVYLANGGVVYNDAGSIIEATGTGAGDCITSGICAIVSAADQNTGMNIGGAVTLTNLGTIIGNVQLIPTAMNEVTLSPGSSIHGDLNMGSGLESNLTLTGDLGTVQLYSQAVTGVTTFGGFLNKEGAGTWILDSNDLSLKEIQVAGGTLQIGNGGTQGFAEPAYIVLGTGRLVFDRSDNVTIDSEVGTGTYPYSGGTLVQAGSGTLTLSLAGHIFFPINMEIDSGILQLDNTGSVPGPNGNYSTFYGNVLNNSALVANSNAPLTIQGVISGTGSLTQNGSNTFLLQGANTYSGGTTVNNGTLLSTDVLPGDVVVNAGAVLDGYANYFTMPGVAGNLLNAGKVFDRNGDSTIGGNYTQASTGTLAVDLGSKLVVNGTAKLNGGTLEIIGANAGYVSNTHTNVITAAGGLTGTFSQLIKDAGIVFTATTINYDANNVWLDTTGLNITNAITSQGGSFTPASFGSAQRVQGAFDQLDKKIATGNMTNVSSDFVKAAGQFQQAPTVQAAQASLQSLSGQLHAASAAMTFEAIDASSRALSDRFDDLLGKHVGYGMWTHDLSVGGDMARAGFNSVGFQLNGWLVGNDRQIGRDGVAGYAFGQSRSRQQLEQAYDHDNSRTTEGMLYAGWLSGNWYTQGRVGFGHIQQDVNRQLLLGDSSQGVGTEYGGNYSVAYEEGGLHFGNGNSRVMPYVNVQYARIDRDGFAEQGAGGFGLRSDAQTMDRWQAGLGVRASQHWDLGGGRAVDFSARAQWQRSLAEHGEALDASFVGLQQWQPLVGIGLSRYSGLFGVGMNATLSKRTTLKFNYDYETGQYNHVQTLMTQLDVQF